LTRWRSTLAAGLACGALALAGGACHDAASASPPAATPAPASKQPEVVAWVLPYENSFQSLERNARFLSIASPTFFRLNVDAKKVKLEDWDPAAPFPRARLANTLRGASASVLPLVGCIGPCGPKISRVLDDDAARKDHVDDLVRVARDEDLAGLVVDYEDVDAREAAVSRFVEELAAGLHAMHRRLVLVVQEPCGADPACKRTPYPFALKNLARAVDLLVVMEYDYVVDGSGPPAPRGWVELGLRKVAASVADDDRAKIVCGVPLYGRLTSGIADDTAVLFDDIKPGSVRNKKATIGQLKLDPEALSKVATVSVGAKTGTLYVEDRETFVARIAQIGPLGLGGIALWRLGGEDPCIGPELAKLRGVAAPACGQ
jgi:spore germination protein YaaH